ncbi:MAG: RDD family protein [Pseudomonadota bacterium]
MNHYLKIQTASVGQRLGIIIYESMLAIALCVFVTLLTVIPIQKLISSPSTRIYLTQAINLFALFTYFTWSWSHGRRTLPMKTWKTHLASINGLTVSTSQAFIRCLIILAPWMMALLTIHILELKSSAPLSPITRTTWAITALVFPWAWAIFHPKKLPLHDACSGTQLLRDF